MLLKNLNVIFLRIHSFIITSTSSQTMWENLNTILFKAFLPVLSSKITLTHLLLYKTPSYLACFSIYGGKGNEIQTIIKDKLNKTLYTNRNRVRVNRTEQKNPFQHSVRREHLKYPKPRSIEKYQPNLHNIPSREPPTRRVIIIPWRAEVSGRKREHTRSEHKSDV